MHGQDSLSTSGDNDLRLLGTGWRCLSRTSSAPVRSNWPIGRTPATGHNGRLFPAETVVASVASMTYATSVAHGLRVNEEAKS